MLLTGTNKSRYDEPALEFSAGFESPNKTADTPPAELSGFFVSVAWRLPFWVGYVGGFGLPVSPSYRSLNLYGSLALLRGGGLKQWPFRRRITMSAVSKPSKASSNPKPFVLETLKGENPRGYLLEIRDGYIALSSFVSLLTGSSDNQLATIGAVLEPIVNKLYGIGELKL